MVVVHGHDIAVSIRVVIPTTAVIHYIVDTTDLILTAYAQTNCIILTILGGWEVDSAEHWGVEATWCAKTVDTESVVATVVWCPLFMVDYARRNHIAVEVGQLVSTHYHCAVLLVESVDELLYGVLVEVSVVRVELDSETTAFLVVESYVPVATDSVPSLVLSDINEVVVTLSHDALDYIYRTVLRVVVHNDHIELVRSFNYLTKSALDSGTDSTNAVLARDNHRCLILEATTLEVNVFEARSEVAIDIFEVLGSRLLHLDLYATVLRIHIVEVLLASGTVVELYIVIEVLVDVLQSAFLAHFKAEVIETSILIINIHASNSLFHSASAIEKNRTKLEIVADRTQLVVNNRSVGTNFTYLVEVVSVNHSCLGVLDKSLHTLESEENE